MRLARSYDEARADADAGEDQTDAQLLKRLATAVGKYWTCKRTPNHAFEALECLGGAGYVEESGMPRLYREAPLASIWEGSGNVMSLDVLRALSRSPRALEVFLDEVEQAAGARRAPGRPRARAEGPVRRPHHARDPRTARRRRDGAVPAGLAARAHTAPALSPTRSAPPAWRATADSSTGRFRRAPTSRRSSPAAARRPSHRAAPRRKRCQGSLRLPLNRCARVATSSSHGSSGSESASASAGSSSSSSSSTTSPTTSTKCSAARSRPPTRSPSRAPSATSLR